MIVPDNLLPIVHYLSPDVEWDVIHPEEQRILREFSLWAESLDEEDIQWYGFNFYLGKDVFLDSFSYSDNPGFGQMLLDRYCTKFGFVPPSEHDSEDEVQGLMYFF